MARRGPQRARSASAVPADYARSLEARLTETGLAGTRETARAGDVLLIACGALAREVLAVREASGFGHLVVECLPAKLHNAPEQIAPAVRAKLRDARARGYEKIFVLYADCGTGGALDRLCAEEGVERIRGPHCYAFFDGVDAFEARGAAEMRAFFLTDFFVKQFDALLWRGLGLDRHPELRDMMFGNYEKLVYLAQTEDPALETKARDAADRLGLAYARRFTGYGELAGFIRDVAGRD